MFSVFLQKGISALAFIFETDQHINKLDFCFVIVFYHN